MGRECERKYLVRRDLWHSDPARGVRYRQGYLSSDPARVVRVRTAHTQGFLTVKGLTAGIERPEFEYAIPLVDAEFMLDHLCVRPLVEKVRYRIDYRGRTWEVDEFAGANAGLVVAEVELEAPDARVERPPWVDREVSDDPRYFNSNLAAHPFREWGDR
jgi:CYTH domain-containing protein